MKNKLLVQYQKYHSVDDEKLASFQTTSNITIHSGSLFTGYDDFVVALDDIKSSDNDLVVIHPDYDVDGVMGGRIAKTGLDILKVSDRIELYYPKSKDGYGLSVVAVDKILDLFPDCKYIITVDNGINTKEAVDYAWEKGIKVIVTDHHPAKLDLYPDKAIAAINPKRVDKKDTYPFKGVSGTCVIWKLLLAYAQEKGLDREYELIYHMMPLVGISIISDVMPVVDENRRILRESIEIMNSINEFKKYLFNEDVPTSYLETFNGLRLMLEFLISKSKYRDGEFSDKVIGFSIAPMLNAPRRMYDDSELAFKLFTLDDDHVINQLYAVNEQRKEEVAIASSKFMTQYPEYEISQLHGIVAQADYVRHGIVGLIAGNITEHFKIPSIILSKDYSGSARAPFAYDLEKILEAIDQEHPEYLVSWGGHEQAAGVTVNEEYYQEFCDAFNRQCEIYLKTVDVDKRVVKEKAMRLDIDELPTIIEIEHAMKIFDSIKPYSYEVPEPKFKVTFDYLQVEESYLTNGKHVKFSIKDKVGNKLDVILWGQGEKAKAIDPYRNAEITVSGLLDVNVWKSYSGNVTKTAQLTSTVMSVEYTD